MVLKWLKFPSHSNGQTKGKCIVHFGMHKTGSTSIQASLYRNLDDSDFHYIDLDEANASVGIITAFKDNPEEFYVHKANRTPLERVNQIREVARIKLKSELKKAKNKVAILSGEEISSLSEDEFRLLAEFLSSAGREVNAVGYIRSPKSFIESVFQQKLTARELNFNIKSHYPNYRKLFEKFITVLGKEKIQFWPFNPKSFFSGCVVQDFCKRTGIHFQPHDVIYDNTGLSLHATKLLYAYRKLGPGFGQGYDAVLENHMLVSKLRQAEGPKFRFHSTLIEPIIEKHRKDIEWMEAQLGASLTEDMRHDDELAIRSEEDMLHITPESTQWLASQLGLEYERQWREEISALEIAEWVHALRTKLAYAGSV